jgi:hypothetical protein
MASEDTQNKMTEQEALIAEMLRDAQKGEVPSSLKENPVIHKGDEVLEAPMTVKEISSAGYVWVWDTRTYEKIPILYYMLPSKLRQRRPDGSYRFTTTDPGKPPRRGTIKCLLPPDNPKREEYNARGLRVCRKSNITNQYQLRQHMIKKHPQEWAEIEEERKEREKREDRELQRALLARATPTERLDAIIQSDEVSEVIAKKVMEKVVPREVKAIAKEAREQLKQEENPPYVCPVCKADFGAKITLEKHIQEKHK